MKDFESERYKPLAKIGQGAVGSVYKTRDVQLKRIVALKTLSTDNSEKFVHRFQIEAKANAQLDHPNIVKIYDFGQLEDGKLFIAMEYLEGVSLEERIRKSKGEGVELEEAITLLIQICCALEASHKKGIIHRDIKPSNVMLVEDEKDEIAAKVLDFGTARLKDSDQSLTKKGAAVGTPFYMSPEAVKGEKLDTASDIYSFGCLAYELLSGNKLFHGNSKIETMSLQLNEHPPSLKASSKQDIPDALESLVARCLRKDPQERFTSFSEVLEILDSIESGLYTDRQESESTLEEIGDSGSKATTILIVSILSILLTGAIVYLAFTIYEDFSSKKVKVKPLEDAEMHYTMFQNLERYKPKLEQRMKKGAFIIVGNINQDSESLKFLKGRTDIKELVLKLANLKGDTLKYVSGLKLDLLNLFGSDIDDTTLEYVGKIDSLTTLNLFGCAGHTNNGIANLSSLKNLEVLDLGQTSINKKGLESLTSIKTLRVINLGQCPDVSEDVLPTLAKFPRLFRLVISNGNLEKCDLTNLKLLKVLKDLSISKIPPNLIEIMKGLKLESLSINENYKIDEEFIAKLAKVKSLKLVTLVNCSGVSDSLLARINKSNPGLKIENKVMKDGLLSRMSGVEIDDKNFWTDLSGHQSTIEGYNRKHHLKRKPHSLTTGD